jgi:hypothetical protein
MRGDHHRKRKTPKPPNVGKEVLAQQRKEILDCPGKVRRNRSKAKWHELYEQRMAEKRAAQSKEAAE